MANINYVSSIVKILEKPSLKNVGKQVLMTKLRAQLPQLRSKKTINLVFWGNLANDIKNYYHINDYILIEGYLSFCDRQTNKLRLTKQSPKKAQITVFKVYPFSLNLQK